MKKPHNTGLMLHNVKARHSQLLAEVMEADGIISPEIMAELEINETQLQEAGISIGHLIKSLTYDEEIITMELDRLKKLREKVTKARDIFEAKLSAAMQQYGIERLESPTLKLSFRKAYAVEIADIHEVPAIYFNQPPPVVSKRMIADAIKDGKVVPGVEIVERKHLQIK